LHEYEHEITRRLSRKVALARAALFWEQLWPLVLPPAAIAGGFLALGLFGLWQDLPPLVHLVALVLVAISIGFTLVPFARLRWPSHEAGRDRLDRLSRFAHRPAESFDDRLAGTPDATQAIIWEAHRRGLIDKVRALAVGAPRPRLWRHDPYGLRAGVILSLVVATAYAGPDWWVRLSGAVTPGAIAQSAPMRLDGWITPPTYTARPPIFIADGSKFVADIVAPLEPLNVPEMSELVLRVHGNDNLELTLKSPDGTPIAAEPLQSASDDTDAGVSKISAGDPGPINPSKPSEIRYILNGDSQLTLNSNGTQIVWQFKVVRDTPPAISFADDVETTGDEALKIIYSAKDDYGVVGARVTFKVVVSDEPPQLGEDQTYAIDPDAPRLELKAPDFDLLLPGNRVRDATRTVYKDLTAHPWAGLDVEMQLSAVDEAGQTGKSQYRRIILPQRRFTNPLARAVVEQRRNLVADPWRHDRVARALNALTIAPERFSKNTSVYLGLRTAFYRSYYLANSEQLADLVEFMWDIALNIEDGDLSLAERELRAAQDALERALAEGAPPEDIDRLVQELRQALDRFMTAMREEAIREAARQPQQPLGPNQRMLQSSDIDKMMDMIEQLSKSGANEAAQRLLEQLRNLLENLEGARAQAGEMSPEQNQMSETLDELSRMLGEQQRLLDETFRQNGSEGQQGQQGRQGQQGQPGRQGQQGREGQGENGQGQSLAERQEALRQQLQRLMDQMANGGLEVPGQLPRAGSEMGAAEGRLSEGEPGQALGPQGQAIDALREGARAMAQQLADGMAAQSGRNQRGQNRGDGQTDPLGRPRRAMGPDFGLSVKIPDEIDAETARELREELQRRLGDRTRRLLERNYLERLLKRF